MPVRRWLSKSPLPEPRSGSIIGTVTDVQDDVVPGATVVLDGGGAGGQQKATTNQNGLFSFSAVQPGVSYHVTIHANGFADWTSPAIQITPGQYMDLGSIPLTISVAATTVAAALPQEEIATEQVHVAEKQRALGFIPAFYAVYDPHPVPLTPKLKFRLAFRTATDPVTLLASAFIAGIDQATDRPDFVQGAQGYGQRYGANYANTLTDIFVGGAILPTILHQDPRYFYQGTGSNEITHVACDPDPVCLQGGQRPLAAELFESWRVPGFGRACQYLLSDKQSRTWAGIQHGRSRYRRQHCQFHPSGVLRSQREKVIQS